MPSFCGRDPQTTPRPGLHDHEAAEVILTRIEAKVDAALSRRP